MINRIRIFVFDYWHYLLFGIFAAVVILGVMYFSQQQYEKRQKRLNRVSIDRVSQVAQQEPVAAPEEPVDGMLLPPMTNYLPLPNDWAIREEWGEPVVVMERRIPEVTLRQAPARTGPDVSP